MQADEGIRLWTRDDGLGKADLGRESGLTGLNDRVEALDRTMAGHEPYRRMLPLTLEAVTSRGAVALHHRAGRVTREDTDGLGDERSRRRR
jgi:hypothetical protein